MSYPIIVRFATSLPGAIPSGTVRTSPISLTAASASMAGLRAASIGVRPPSSGQGVSAMPSHSKTTDFIQLSPL